MNILTIKAYFSSQFNTSRAYLYIAVEKLKNQKLCCCAAPLSLPHSCRNNLSHTGDSLSLSLSLRWGLGFFFFFFFAFFFFFIYFFLFCLLASSRHYQTAFLASSLFFFSFQSFSSFLLRLLVCLLFVLCVQTTTRQERRRVTQFVICH